MAQVFIRPAVHEEKKKMDTVARKGRIKIGEKKVMSSPECSLMKVVISCVATACPENLQRDKMNMEW